MHQVRAATRRKYTPEEKIRIVLEGFRREVAVNDLCRREGTKPHSYYSWTKEYGMQSTPNNSSSHSRWFSVPTYQLDEDSPKLIAARQEGLIGLDYVACRYYLWRAQPTTARIDSLKRE